MAEAFSQDSFARLKRRLDQGDPAAAEEIFERFSRRLAALAREQLGPRLRAKLDPEDVTQSVFRSFFRRQEAGELTFASWESLWSLLVVITLRKCGHQVQHYLAARRDVRRELGQAPGTDLSSEDVRSSWRALVREPTPEEAAALTDLLERLMHRLKPLQREILTLRLQGHSTAEIAQQVKRSQRMVQYTLQAVRAHLEKLLASGGAGADNPQ